MIKIDLFNSDFLMPGDPGPEPASTRMTNDDFRKLMMTPRAGSSGSTASHSASGGSSGVGATPKGAAGAAAMTPRIGSG